MIRVFATATLMFFPACAILAQSTSTPQTFGSATIKLSSPYASGVFFRRAGPTHFVADNHTLKECIAFAYQLPPRLITGGPDWINSVRYDMVLETSGQIFAEIPPTFQAFLADRFKLLVHREPKQSPIYNLVIGQSELKITKSTASHQRPSLFISGQPPRGNILPARNATMEEFSSLMQRTVMDRAVVDKTGLTGRYDFDLKWGTETADIFIAIQQLGLALEPAEGFADALIVDSIEKPNTD